MSFKTAREGRSMIPVSELERINQARIRDEMSPLASGEELDATLQKAGITHCEGKPYPWATR